MQAVRDGNARLTTITPVVAEWWRGPSDWRIQMKRMIEIVPLSTTVAEAAGVVLGTIGGKHERAALAIDAMVVAFAALQGGGLVYTSDLDDLERVAVHFPSVRLLAI